MAHLGFTKYDIPVLTCMRSWHIKGCTSFYHFFMWRNMTLRHKSCTKGLKKNILQYFVGFFFVKTEIECMKLEKKSSVYKLKFIFMIRTKL